MLIRHSLAQYIHPTGPTDNPNIYIVQMLPIRTEIITLNIIHLAFSGIPR